MRKMSERLQQEQEKFMVDQQDWRDVGAGLSVLDLHETNGRRLQLVRIAPGGRVLAHRHVGTEIMYIVRGSLIVDGIRMRAGEVLIAPAGSIHRETVSAEGCEMILECSPEDELLRS
jgi:quercetin dioxygenase-like cupin family protein